MRKKNFFNSFINSIKQLNNSKFFAGIIMIMLNIGSKYITIELSKSQEQYLRNKIARQLLIFSISWMGTRDIIVALILTAVFNILTLFLFNEKSNLCVIPTGWRNYEDKLKSTVKKEDYIDKKKLKEALDIVEKSKKLEQKREQFRVLSSFASSL